MKTYIVLAEVDLYDRRNFAEDLENSIHRTIGDFMDKFSTRGKDGQTGILIFSFTDFMDACNDQEINLENYWVTYINIKSD